jgi:Divergent InlB B-repeat domain
LAVTVILQNQDMRFGCTVRSMHGAASTAIYLLLSATTRYTLTTQVSPAGTGTVSGAGSYAAGTRLQVTATPAPGYYFQKFTRHLAGGPNPQILFMDGNYTVTGNFLPVNANPQLLASTGSRTSGASGQLTISMRLTDSVGIWHGKQRTNNLNN